MSCNILSCVGQLLTTTLTAHGIFFFLMLTGTHGNVTNSTDLSPSCPIQLQKDGGEKSIGQGCLLSKTQKPLNSRAGPSLTQLL